MREPRSRAHDPGLHTSPEPPIPRWRRRSRPLRGDLPDEETPPCRPRPPPVTDPAQHGNDRQDAASMARGSRRTRGSRIDSGEATASRVEAPEGPPSLHEQRRSPRMSGNPTGDTSESGWLHDDIQLEFEAARTNGNAYLYMAAQFDEQSCGRRLMCEIYQKPHESLTEDEVLLQDIFG